MDATKRKFLLQAFAGSSCLLWTGYGLSPTPKFNGWELKVDGLVTNPQHFGIADLTALSGAQQHRISLSQILKEVKPLKRARYVVLHCVDRTLCIDMVTAYAGKTMLVYDGAGMSVTRIELRDKA